MSGFLGSPTVPTEEPAIDSGGGWWPEVSAVALRAAARLDGTVTQERLRAAGLFAIASVQSELAPWKAARMAEGHESMAVVPAGTVGGVSVLVSLYLRAVYALVQADLNERYRDFDTTGAGDKRADELCTRVDELRRDARWAISDILGVRRTTVELI